MLCSKITRDKMQRKLGHLYLLAVFVLVEGMAA